MIRRFLGCAVVCGWLLASVPVQAHHSIAGVYDMHTTTTLSGEVEKVLFINPHGSLTVAVKSPDGTKTTDWVLTLGGVASLAAKGVGRTGPNSLHAGDKITVKFLPAKDGSPVGFLRTITWADGHTIEISGENATF